MRALTLDIRPAQPRDAIEIADVHAAAWQNAYAGIIPYRALRAMIGRRDHRWWQRAIRRGTSMLVIDLDGTIGGYVTFGLNRARALPQDGEVYELYLRPEYQGVGFGSRLFRTAANRLSSHGCKGLVVWALEDNATAIDFYRGRGGRPVAEGAEVFDGQRLRKTAFVWD
ncbi:MULTISPECIES: GNAT family N-acetyltransferase [unclassified Roseitalea]|uniref:GNAT family N-acetyltransferase n=1 Tax=unclassified Roseitalea TaxID=2639107 RepID=UPI00273FD0F0|nr:MULTISPECIES: GNAT family N-acetyltransferase [unclassified Roseitalea]